MATILENILNKHDDHTVGIVMRYHKGRVDPVPGLYCLDCCKLIKWLSYTEAKDLLESGVEDLGMLPDELALWNRSKRLKNIP
jgi:hypothetical protein